MKQKVKLTESELRNMIAETVKSVLNEIGDTDKGQDALGQVYGRALRRAQMLGDKGAEARRLSKIAHDAEEKAYSEGEKTIFLQAYLVSLTVPSIQVMQKEKIKE